MSRIEDDREAARLAEKLMLQKREQEQKAKERVTADSAFSRLVQKSQAEQARTQQKDSVARSAIAAMLREEEAAAAEAPRGQAAALHERENARDADGRSRSRSGVEAFQDRLKQAQVAGGERVSSGKLADDAAQGRAASGREGDRQVVEGSAMGRKGDARVQRESLEERKEGSAQSAQGQKGGARFGKGELKADPDQGGQGQQGGSKDQPPGGEAAAGFRLNPALMAPVPVAQARPSGGPSRLRALANEIAQKLVERVRVGTNAAGKAEFQIDLRSNVLAGLSVKVSGSGGRIKAVFSGNDRGVLKLLREQQDSLKTALTARGLTLEELRIEEKA